MKWLSYAPNYPISLVTSVGSAVSVVIEPTHNPPTRACS